MAHTDTLLLPAVSSYADGNPLAIHEQLIEVVSGSPEHTREFAEVAARAVGLHYSKHKVCPEALPHFSTLEEAQEAARHHPGLCGVQHARTIASVKLQDVLDRGHEPKGKKLRNQACFVAAKAMKANGPGVQLARKDCFTHACRALWPGNELLDPAICESFM